MTAMSAPRRPPRRRVDGVLLLDKPRGFTSNAALQRVKRLFNADKAGHTGTLDPLASGLLPICFGDATRFAQFLLDAPKRYVATVRFGATTATQDAEVEVTVTKPVLFARADLEAMLRRFTGSIVQTPPAHSALKFEGRPHYDYARRGIDVPRTPREITIHALELLDWTPPEATLAVSCSKGTYVRTLAADVGDALGCGAHLAALRRTRTGPFDLATASTLDALEHEDETTRDARLLPIDAPLAALPRLDVAPQIAALLACGQRPGIAAAGGRYRIYAPGERFVGVADVESQRLVALRLVTQRGDGDAPEIPGAHAAGSTERLEC
ncbi:MAG TPA: tRNA pseudouridine(55) synthase TruB [Casimicrobiaceae bacterium]|nr:tRNA pseudouridine(55) synthase TruB [Casimicrobiaceae bacterium]